MKACVPQCEDPGESCERVQLVGYLKGLLNDYEEPLCPRPKASVQTQICNCKKPDSDFGRTGSKTMTLVGEEGRRNFVSKKNSKPTKWNPYYPPLGQPLHKSMPCFAPPTKVELPLQEFDVECDCPAAEGPHQHYRRGTRHTIAEVAQDYCTSGVDKFFCVNDKRHHHWLPHKGKCIWPKPCLASCFDHSDFKDWINNHPPSLKKKDDKIAK